MGETSEGAAGATSRPGKTAASTATPRAHAWAAIALGFLAVLGVAYYCFTKQQARRTAELQSEYARSIDHVGRQIELRYLNYGQVVASWTAMANEVDRLETKKPFEKDAEARTRAAQRSLAEAQARHEAAKRQRKAVTDTIHVLDAVYANLANDADAESALQGQIESAKASAKAAVDASTEADREAQEAAASAQAAADAATHAGDAAAAAAKAAAHAAAATANSPPATVTAETHSAAAEAASASTALGDVIAIDGGASSGAPPAPDPATAAAAAASAREAAEQANALAAQRAAEADRTRKRAELEDDAAQEQRHTLTALVETLETAEDGKRATSAVAAQAFTAFSSATRVLKKAEVEARRAAEDAARARATPADIAQEERGGLGFQNLLSSYRKDLEECRVQPASGGGESVGLCMARRIATANEADARGVSIVPCPPGVTPSRGPVVIESADPTRSADPVIVFPPSAGADAMAGVCGQVAISRLLGSGPSASTPWVVEPQEEVFDQVLLLKDDGTALYASPGGANVRVITLPGFDAKAPRASRFVPEVPLGTSAYEELLQPIDVPAAFPCSSGDACPTGSSASTPPPSTRSGGLVLCGLVQHERFLHDRDRVLPITFLLGAALAGMGVLLLPLAKLWLVGPRSRFRRFDIALLVTSALVATFLCTMLFFSYLATNQLDHRLDHDLDGVSKTVAARLKGELAAGANALSQFTRRTVDLQRALHPGGRDKRAASPKEACKNGGVSGGASGPPNGGESGAARDGCSLPVCEVTTVSYQNLLDNAEPDPGASRDAPAPETGWTLAFWANASGRQQIKYVPPPFKHAPNPIDVSKRQYFQRALKNDVGCLASSAAECASRKFDGVPEVVRSATSGKIVLIIARPTFDVDPPPPDAPANGVAGVEWNLRAFKAPLLPVGFQLAVVDAKGVVMLHSNNDAHQGQSIFDDLSDPGPLRALMAADTTTTLDANYLGVGSRVHVNPLPGVGWYVLTIARKDLVESPTATMVMLTAAGYAWLVALVAFAGGAVLVATRVACRLAGNASVRRHTLRPSSAHANEYGRAALTTLAGTAALCVGAVALAPSVPIAVFLVLSVALALGSVWILPGNRQARRPSRGADEGASTATAPSSAERDLARRRAPMFPLAYASCCFGLAGALVVAPATVLFVGAFDQSVDNLVRTEQEHIARPFRYDAACFDGHPDSANVHCGPSASLFRSERVEPADAPTAARWAWWLWPLPYLEDLLPPLAVGGGDWSARLYRAPCALDPANPADRAWHRASAELDLLASGAASKCLMTAVPQLRSLGNYDLESLVGLVGAILALLLLAHVIAFLSIRRLLFLDLAARLAGRPPLAPETWRGSKRKILVLGAPPELEATLRTQEFEPADATAEAAGADASIFLAIDGLLESADHAARVGRLSQTEGTVVLLARVDPIANAPAALRASWADALMAFEIERAPAASDPRLDEGCRRGTALFVHLWNDTTEDERRVLAQMAIDGHPAPHPANTPVLEHLCSRGLLDPSTLAIASNDFADFVRRTMSTADLEAWENTDGGTAWGMLRVPLLTGITALLAILGNSHIELAATGALVPSIAAALPPVLKILMGSSSAS